VLRDLHIKNMAVVADAAMEFRPGFNVLSGETGAGKSIVTGSLGLLAGARASSELIRSGTDTLTVTGVFSPGDTPWRDCLQAAGIAPDDEQLIIRREISSAGNNRVFINDQPATLRLVRTLAPFLLRIHGQREELGLVTSDLQRTWLDRCGGPSGAEARRAVAEAYRRWQGLRARLTEDGDKRRERLERIDLLRFQLAEIEDAQVEAGEEEALRRERDVLRNAEAIVSALAGVVRALYDDDGAAYERLAESHRRLEAIGQWEKDAAGWALELEELRIRTGELAEVLRRRLDGLEADPRRLDQIETRLSTLERLMRKHGGSTAAVLERAALLAAELEQRLGDDGNQEQLRTAAEEALAEYRRAALALSSGRAKWSVGLAARTRRELADLALGKARFKVDLERRTQPGSALELAGERIGFSVYGIDQVSFKFSPNPGEEAHTLSSAASGGELSRLYLAVQLAARSGRASERFLAPTLVFDEVDSGIGGAEAAALGDKLRRLAQGGQILAVTHLPQVASQADVHFKVSKAVRGARTHTVVERLASERRTEEVARMLAGSEITELSLSHARELIAGTVA